MRSALRLLQPIHANTQFSQVEVPPCDRGFTWSIVNSSPPGWQLQYWQAQWSRLKILRRLKLTAAVGNDLDQRIYVRGDKAVSYGTIMTVMGALNGAGFQHIGLVALKTPDT